MKLEKVAVLGAGAVGAYVLWGLSEKPGIRLGVVAEGERARRLQNGIGINAKGAPGNSSPARLLFDVTCGAVPLSHYANWLR